MCKVNERRGSQLQSDEQQVTRLADASCDQKLTDSDPAPSDLRSSDMRRALDSVAKVNPADWVRRVVPLVDAYRVGSVIPDHFSAYVRIEHEAIPGHRRRSRQLTDKMIRVLYPLLRDATTTPDQCWFCVWGPGGHLRAHTLRHPLRGSTNAPRSPIATHRLGCSLRRDSLGSQLGLPRAFHLYSSKLSDIGPVRGFPWALTPDVWWPEDHAWCVASEAHLTWSYLGGDRSFIDSVCADPLLEAREVRPCDPVSL
jgi:hypothetical protein